MISDEEASLRADPGLVADWIAGRALSRGVSPPIPAYGSFRVDVRLPDEKARYVFAAACEGLRQAANVTADTNDFLKVCAPPVEARRFLSEERFINTLSYMTNRPDLTFENWGAPRVDAFSVSGRQLCSIRSSLIQITLAVASVEP